MREQAPPFDSLPAPVARSVRGGPTCGEISVVVEVVTPILGGSSTTRAIDEVDIIRGATVRGHLRFWWRALNAAEQRSAELLYARGASKP